MKKTIECGKIDWYGLGRKINAVTLDVKLYDSDKGPVLFVCGNVWNSKRTDIVAGGQCLNELAKFPQFAKSGKYAEIMSMWRKHHRNGLRAGTERQEAVLARWKKRNPGKLRSYDTDCDILKKAKCYVDNGYTYGSAWLYRPIPEDDLAKIRKWLGE